MGEYNLIMNKYILIILSSLLFVIPFLNFNFFFLSWFCFIGILYLIENKNGSPIKIGILFGILSTFFGLYWITWTINNLTGASFLSSFLVHFSYSFYESIFYVIVFSVLGWVISKNNSKVYKYGLFIFFYIFLENLFPRVFPYKLGNTQILFKELSQLISYAGVNILTIFVLVINIAIYELIFKKNIRFFSIVLSIFFVIFFSGKSMVHNHSKIDTDSNIISVAVVQPNLNLNNLIDINNAINKNTYLTIWPEASLDRLKIIDKRDVSIFKENFLKKFEPRSKFILFGTIYQTNEGYHNAAVLIDQKVNIIDKSFKNKLMIFGEYYPFNSVISKIIPIYDSFVTLKRGEIRPLTLNQKGEIGVIICYEDLFEMNSIKLSEDGAGILINITNDRWYGDSLASYQHLMLSIPRAIENRKYLIRSANNGISAIINPAGTVMNQIGPNEKGLLNEKVALLKTKSFYTRYYKPVNYLYHLIFLIFFIIFLHKFRNS